MKKTSPADSATLTHSPQFVIGSPMSKSSFLPKMELTCRSLRGKPYSVLLEPNTCIADIRHFLSTRLDIPRSDILLVHHGATLNPLPLSI
jgi:hypothetical protein